MKRALRPFSLGWHPIDPGPGPRSRLLDRPPAASRSTAVVDHQRWRQAVEADERVLLQSHQSGPSWFPVPLPADVHVVPVFGGTPQAIEQIVSTLVLSGIETGLSMCRVVNLSGWDLSATLRHALSGARHNRALFEEVGSTGSTVNLFGNPRSDELIALLGDALRVSAERSAGRATQQDKQEIERIARLLRGSVTLDRLIEAIDIALGSPGPAPHLSRDESRDLQDYHATTVAQRRGTGDRLTDLHVDLEALRRYGKSTTRSTASYGTGSLTLRWFDVTAGRSADESELGRQLIARAVTQAFVQRGPEELLVVVGAERLSDEVREEMVDAAQREYKRVALVYTKISDAGARMLGHAGSSVAIFLRLPHHADATVGAEFLGREYTFVVNGISIADGQTQEWSSSFGTSTSRTITRGSSSSGSSGLSGTAFNFSHSFGTSVSRSLQTGTSTTTSQGGSQSQTRTQSAGRVHEYVVEPEVFQQLPEDLMMVVINGRVVLASCDTALRRGATTSRLVLTP